MQTRCVQTDLPRGKKACGARQAEVEQQTTCARQEEMASMSGRKQDEAKVEIAASKWRELGEHDTKAPGQQEAGEAATETERAEAGPCRACSSDEANQPSAVAS